jgi:uncharacterized protein with WD repeat
VRQWTSDESYCLRLVTNAIEVYEGRSLEKGFIGKVAAIGVVSMAVSPSPRLPVKVAAFTPETSGRPASVRVHQFPQVADATVASKTFYNAQECELDWAPNGRTHGAALKHWGSAVGCSLFSSFPNAPAATEEVCSSRRLA